MKFYFFILLIIQLLGSTWFYKKQNQGSFVGGAISIPKALWLFYAIFFWFFLPLIYLSHPALDGTLKVILALHTLIWWIRGPLELAMIYKWFNWSPRYGIIHDVLHAGVLFIALLGTVKIWPESPSNWMLFVFLGFTIISLLFEATFAALFLNIRGSADHKIYYADDSEKWRFVNFLTTVAVILGLFHLVVQASCAFFIW